MVAFNFQPIYFFYRLLLSLCWNGNLFWRDKSREPPGGSHCRVRRRGCWCWCWSPSFSCSWSAPPRPPSSPSSSLNHLNHRSAPISASRYSGRFPTTWSSSTLPSTSTSTAFVAQRSGERSSWPSSGFVREKPNLVKPLPCHISSQDVWLTGRFSYLSPINLFGNAGGKFRNSKIVQPIFCYQIN